MTFLRSAVVILLTILLLTLTPCSRLAAKAADGGTQIRCALFIDDGTEASEFVKEFRRNSDAEILYQKIDSDDLGNGILKDFDVLVMPGGSATTEGITMGPEAREEIRRFVRKGGIYLGVCAGAFLASREKDVYLGMLPLRTLDEDHWLRTTGTPLMDVELTPPGMEVFGFTTKNVKITYECGPIFGKPFERPDDTFTPLGYFRTEVVAPGGTPGLMIGAPAGILSRYGRGSVLVLSPHPEETPGMKQVELQAIRWLYAHRNVPYGFAPQAHPLPPWDSSTLNVQAVKLAESIFDRVEKVSYDHQDAPADQQITKAADGKMAAQVDSSGFISYIISSIAPRHYQVIRQMQPHASYPQAKTWARFFDELIPERPIDGWLAVPKWEDLRSGDTIAWEESDAGDNNTGHIMMVMSKPGAPQQASGCRFFEVQVMDSSPVSHFAPERLPPKAAQKQRDGLGIGNVRIAISDKNEPIGYWVGTRSGETGKPITGPTPCKLIRFARMVSVSLAK